MRIANNSLITSAVTLNTDWTSGGVWLGHIVNYSIQLVFTGTPNGTFKLQYSNDKGNEDKTLGGWDSTGVTNWTDVPDSQEAVTAAGSLIWNAGDCGYRWVRAVYVFGSSTGSLTVARFNGKGI